MFSICDQGRVAAGRLWRSSGMAPEVVHRGVHIAEESWEPARRLHTVEIPGRNGQSLLPQCRT